MKRPLLLLALLFAFFRSDLSAQTKIELQPNDTILSVLQRNVGQTVELRLKSGEKIGGKVEKIADKVVHLSQLTGAEYFDAVVDIADLSAVVVRAKSK
jgi:hypothetical protein